MTLQELLTGTYIFTNSYNIVNVCKKIAYFARTKYYCDLNLKCGIDTINSDYQYSILFCFT